MLLGHLCSAIHFPSSRSQKFGLSLILAGHDHGMVLRHHGVLGILAGDEFQPDRPDFKETDLATPQSLEQGNELSQRTIM